MRKSFRIIFLEINKDKSIEIYNNEQRDYLTLCTIIEIQKKGWENISDIKNLRAYLKKSDPQQKSPTKYIKLEKRQEILEHIYNNSYFQIQFFCGKNQESYRKIIRNIDINLNQIQRYLSNLTNQLKDQVNQLNAPNIIRRNTSKDYQIIQVFLVVCDPLVEQDNNDKQTYNPLYHDQIDISSHVQRLKKASLSNSDLTIKVSRLFGTFTKLNEVLHNFSSHNQNHLFSIVQIFTRIQKRDGILYMSVQSQSEEGVRQWYAASRIFSSEVSVNIIIVIGVGAYQLLQLDQLLPNTRLICITTISLEDKRILANIDQRNPIDNQNSYSDHSSQLFIEEFYSHLFKRNKIQQSYEHAYNLFKAEAASNIWCCCLHIHHQSCTWSNLIKKVGQPEAHRLFKHGRQFWRKRMYFDNSCYLQLLLSAKKQKQRIEWKQGCCPQTTTCCWEKMGIQKVQILHSNLSKVIVTNQKQLDQQFYAHIQARFQRPNRFQTQSYEKPIGIRPPLTIFLAVKHIRKHSFSILQSDGVSHGKKLFMYVKEYLQVRTPNLQFFQIKVGLSLSNSEKTELQKQINKIKQKKNQPMGASTKSRTLKIYLWTAHNGQKSQNKYYQKLLQEFWHLVKKQTSLKIQLKLILIIDRKAYKQFQRQNPFINNPLNFSKKVNITQLTHYLTDNHLSQQFHNVLSRHSYQYITKNLLSLQNLILDGVVQDKNNECQNFNIQSQFEPFLGFLAQFSEQGFHLTKVTRVIVRELFEFQSHQFIDQAIAKSQGLEHIQVADYTYLQLTKKCQEHFNAMLPGQRLKYLQKKLQFYYILMHLYFQLWPLTQAAQYPSQIRNYINKKGIFSIDISCQSSRYQDNSKNCLQEISKDKQIMKILFDTSNTIHIYHIHQIQRMLDQIVKKKKNRHNPSSRSFINQKSYQTFQYLLWNIIHKSWLMAQVLYKSYTENIQNFKTKLLQFIEKAEINLPISGIAVIQLTILMNQNPPALKDNDFGLLTNFIGKYRHFAYKQRLLQTLQPKWGHLQQFKTFFGNCFHLALQIGTLIDETKKRPDSAIKASNYIDQIRYKQKMFKNSTGTIWRLQCLKLIQRKLLYYYSFTSDLKKNQSLTEFTQKSTLIQNYFKLREISYEYDQFKHRIMLETQLDKNSQLIQLYLNFLLKVKQPENRSRLQSESEQKKLLELESKISPQYMPIFNYLYQKFEQKALFNQKDLIIFARARTIIDKGQPYVYIRKRTLLTQYLCKVLQKNAIKVSYFSLTNQTLNIFQRSQNNNCEVLCMILTVDTTDQDLIMVGTEEGVDSTHMTIQAFADKIKKCRIKILILCGKNSKKVCQKLRGSSQIGYEIQCSAMIGNSIPTSPNIVSSSMIKSKNMKASTIGKSKPNPSTSQINQTNQSNYNFPTIIAIQNNKYSLQDAKLFQYELPEITEENDIVPNTRHSIFNRQPSNNQTAQLNQDIQIQQVNNTFSLFDNILKEDEDQIEQKYQKMDSFDVSGRVNFSNVVFRKAESISEQVEQNPLGVQKYISSQVNQIAMDLIVISLVKSITNQLRYSPKIFTEQQLEDIMFRSKQMVKSILYNRFECVDDVFSNIQTAIWNNKHTLSKIKQGNYEDLTKKFYCAQSNLFDQNYYQNVGNCKQVSQAIKFLGGNMNCIQILGGNPITKSSLLQQLCWISQSKSFFKFGIIKLDFKQNQLSHLANKEFADRQINNARTGLLIAIDNVQLLNQLHRQQLRRLRGKQFTLLYSTLSPIKGQELRQILDFKDYQCIDLDKRSEKQLNNQVYANLLCYIKQKNQVRFNHEKLQPFQKKVQEIMQIVQKQISPHRLSKALELLRGTGRNEEERINSFLHFYRQHFQELANILLQVRQITVKFKNPNQ